MRRNLQEANPPHVTMSTEQKCTTKALLGSPPSPAFPDGRGDSIAIDFVGPAAMTKGTTAITITNRLGADVRIAPTHTDITAERLLRNFRLVVLREWSPLKS